MKTQTRMTRLDKMTLLVAFAIAVAGLCFGYDLPVHLLAAPFAIALVVALPLGVIYGLASALR
jgi:hypothetical protein